jgi:hypothetical protein
MEARPGRHAPHPPFLGHSCRRPGEQSPRPDQPATPSHRSGLSRPEASLSQECYGPGPAQVGCFVPAIAAPPGSWCKPCGIGPNVKNGLVAAPTSPLTADFVYRIPRGSVQSSREWRRGPGRRHDPAGARPGGMTPDQLSLSGGMAHRVCLGRTCPPQW